MRTHQGGFSLLEVLVAFAIMAMALGALYQAAGQGVRATAIAENVLRATISAQSLLAAYPSLPAGGVHDSGATPDGMRWQVSSKPHTDVLSTGGGWPLYRLEAQLFWSDAGQERSFSLVTLVPERPQ